MTNNQFSEDSDDNKSRASDNASVSVENEVYAEKSSVGRFTISNTDGQRRRFSRTNSEVKGELSKSSQEKGLQWTTSSVKFNLAEETSTPSEIVSYSLMDEGKGATKRVKTKKMKVSDNDHSHGSFFLRVGAVGQSFNY